MTTTASTHQLIVKDKLTSIFQPKLLELGIIIDKNMNSGLHILGGKL
jgi:hypothetical protein